MDNLLNTLETATKEGNKLVLIIGKPGSGKSKIIHEYSSNTGIKS